MLVGRSSACDFPASVQSLPVVGDFARPDLEKLLSVSPTLVITNDLIQPGIRSALESRGICLQMLPCRNLAEYQHAVEFLAQEMNCIDAGKEELERTQKAIEVFRATASNLKILAILWDSPLLIAGEETIVRELSLLAGNGVLPLDDNKGYFTPNTEWLLSSEPDVILVLDKHIHAEDNRLLKHLSAVKEGRVIQFSQPELLERPGPRWIQGVELLKMQLESVEQIAESRHEIRDTLIFSLRFWRFLAAVMIGGALSISGGLFQTIFRNPLASPYTLGVSSGAATGAAFAYLLGLSSLWIPWTAFFGGMLTLMIVLFFSGFGHRGDQSLLLSGVLSGTILSSVLIYLISIADSEELAGVTWWMLGDLQAVSPSGILLLGVVAVLSLGVIFCYGNDLNALSLGDESAMACGVNVRSLRLKMILIATLLTAISISIAGMIGFVGLVMPHICRRIWGSNQRRISLLNFLAGGFFLAFCDLLCRFSSSVRQTPIGVVTSCIGGAIFLILLLRGEKRRFDR